MLESLRGRAKAMRGFREAGSTEAAEHLLSWAELLARQNPRSATTHMLKGDALARNGKYDQVIDALNEAVRLESGSALVYNLRGAI